MAKLWRCRTVSDGKRQIEEVKADGAPFSRPSLIFLTGFFTYDDTPKYIASALKTMQETMAARPQTDTPLDIYAWSHTGLREIFNVAAYHMRPARHASRAGYALAAQVIMPLVADGFSLSQDGRAAGTPLAKDEAKRRLRNITFFAYSAGTITAQEGYNAALKMMQDIGYDKKDAQEVLREIVLIGTGVVSRPRTEKNRFTTLHLEATNDRIAAANDRLWEPLRTLFDRFATRLKVRKLSPSSIIVTTAVQNKRFEHVTKNGKTERRRVKSMLPSWFPVKTNHELPRYITQDEGFSAFAKIALYSLTNAVNRTQSLLPEDLLRAPRGLSAPETEAFTRKMEAATAPQKKRKWWKRGPFSR